MSKRTTIDDLRRQFSEANRRAAAALERGIRGAQETLERLREQGDANAPGLEEEWPDGTPPERERRR